MILSQTQLTNIIGYINFKLNYMNGMRDVPLNSKSSSTDITTANDNLLQTLDDLQNLLNTLYSHFGRTKPIKVHTLTELKQMDLA